MRANLVMTWVCGAAAVAIGASPVMAGPAWDSIRDEIYDGRVIYSGTGAVKMTAPYRPEDVRSVPIEAEARLPGGRTIKSVSFIVDENPSPVAAKFTLGQKRDRVAITTNIRLNQQSDVRVVVEADDGQLFMVERLVKFAGGQASCSAPPMGDPDEIIANMGKMTLAAVGEKATASRALQRVSYELNHPNHTGMVLDQITLLYVPLLMVNRIEARQGDELVFEMEGSITLAQNPKVKFDYLTNGSGEMTMRATDTSGTSWVQSFPIGPAS